MRPPIIKPTKKTRTYNQIERREVRRPVAARINLYEQYSYLKRYQNVDFIITIDPGKVSPAKLKALKKDGYKKGVFDMYIIAANPDLTKVWYVEFKSKKGTLTKEQKEKAKLLEKTGIEVVIFRNIDEFDSFVEKYLK